MVKWTEVSAYSGLPVEEDAPTNATGVAVAGTGDDSSVVVMKKKKKKTFLDARTKEYKEKRNRSYQTRILTVLYSRLRSNYFLRSEL